MSNNFLSGILVSQFLRFGIRNLCIQSVCRNVGKRDVDKNGKTLYINEQITGTNKFDNNLGELATLKLEIKRKSNQLIPNLLEEISKGK